MPPETVGLIGGILGGVIGIAGGMVGTWMSIRNTSGPRERAFMVRAAAVVWVLVIAFVTGLFLLPSPGRYLLWIPYAVLLSLGIIWMNRRQAQIRREEGAGGHV
ncbi:MAG TPA: hypothetical protein VIL46_03375 [Gemmataceae bacterium]